MDIYLLVKELVLLAVTGLAMNVNANICEVGKEKNEIDVWQWVLPYERPCGCHEIIMGGINLSTPIRSFKPVYVDSPLLSNDIENIRKHYRFECIELLCNDVIPPTNGAVTSNDAEMTEGTTITFSCNEGYLLIGQPLVSCGADGQWSDAPPTCELNIALGMEDGSISDSQITSSSYYSPDDSRSSKARLNNVHHWASSTALNINDWIQVDMLTSVTMSGIKTQGSGTNWPQYDAYMKKLKVKTGMTTKSLVFILDDSGSDMVFQANTEKDTVKIILFPVLIRAQIIRIYPTEINFWCGFRFEVMGCKNSRCS